MALHNISAEIVENFVEVKAIFLLETMLNNYLEFLAKQCLNVPCTIYTRIAKIVAIFFKNNLEWNSI